MQTNTTALSTRFYRKVATATAILTIGIGAAGFALSQVNASHREEGCCERSDARAGQITTMVTRFNQFLPGGAAPITLTDGAIYTAADLNALVVAGYCADADLQNQLGGDWKWNGTTRRFEPAP